jgi:ubiquinone/menaquinone biosynthesis C-methylase UbiE
MTQTITIKNFFQKESNYPDNTYIIRIRKEVISDFLKDKEFKNIIDIACGNAEISTQFLKNETKLTLVDISENMLKRALLNIPQKYLTNVKTICGNIELAKIEDQKYDLVICTGLLAHVSDSKLVLDKLSDLVETGGLLIVQNTDSAHLYSKIIRLYRYLILKFSARKYHMNQLSNRDLINYLKENNLFLIKKYHSVSSFLFLSHIISDSIKYKIIKNIFGNSQMNKRAFLGNDLIYLFQKK